MLCQPEELTNILEICNIVFTSMFSLEMILKLTAFGSFNYLRNPYNVFDGVIVIIRYKWNDINPAVVVIVYLKGFIHLLNARHTVLPYSNIYYRYTVYTIRGAVKPVIMLWYLKFYARICASFSVKKNTEIECNYKVQVSWTYSISAEKGENKREVAFRGQGYYVSEILNDIR